MTQKLVIDTNVLISAVISQSFPYYIVRSVFLNKNLEWCISDEIMQEYQDVLKREKFSKYPGFTLRAETLLASIDTFAKIFTPEIKLHLIKDEADNKFLELAVTCKADYIITVNTNDFTMSSIGKTKIVTPKDYWDILNDTTS